MCPHAVLQEISRGEASETSAVHKADALDIRGDRAEDVFQAAKQAGVRMQWDATEPRLDLALTDAEDVMAAEFSHLPRNFRYGA